MSDPDYSFITKEQLGEVLEAFTKDLESLRENQRLLADVLGEVDVTLASVANVIIKRQLITAQEFERLRRKIRTAKDGMTGQETEQPVAPTIPEEPIEHGGSAQGEYGPEGAFIFGGDGS